MPWAVAAAGVTAAGGIASGLLGGAASSSAAKAQASAGQQALQFQQGVYNNTQSNLAPYMASGNTALTSLMGMLGLGGQGQNATAQSAFQGFTQTPAYQFPLQQGNLALNRQLASAGLTSSGGALKDAIGYNQGFASQGLNSYLGQLAGLSNLGQNSALGVGQQGNQAANNVANTQGYIGNANAAGIMGGAAGLNQAIGSGISGLVGNNNGGIGGPNSALAQGGNWLTSLFNSNPTPTTSSYMVPATGQSYQSSSDPNANF